MLATELSAAELSCPQPCPESVLSFSLVVAQSASAVPKFSGLWLHNFFPHPNPLPQGEGNEVGNLKSKITNG
jgi:hypothetical protein